MQRIARQRFLKFLLGGSRDHWSIFSLYKIPTVAAGAGQGALVRALSGARSLNCTHRASPGRSIGRERWTGPVRVRSGAIRVRTRWRAGRTQDPIPRTHTRESRRRWRLSRLQKAREVQDHIRIRPSALQSGGQSSFLGLFICSEVRRNPTHSGAHRSLSTTNRGARQRLSAPQVGVGGH